MNELLHLLIEKIEEQKSAGKFDRARVIVEEAIAQYPDDFHLYEELADILLYQNDVPSAKKAIEYAQSMQADSPTGLYLMGYANTLESNYPEAIRYLEKSNEGSPNNPEVLRNLGWAYTMTGEIRKGIVLLERALQLNPEDQLIIEDLGMALLSEGNTIEARRLLKQIGKEHKIAEAE